MPAGDSITVGTNWSEAGQPSNVGGYRVNLAALATAASKSINFVGSQSNGPSYLTDREYEGYGGQAIPFVYPFVVTNITAKQAKIVLWHCGTNDSSEAGISAATIISRQETAIRAFKAARSDIIVLWGTLLGNSDGTRNTLMNSHNGLMAASVATLQGEGIDVRIVDHQAAGVAFSDGTHPNKANYDLMAATWWTTLSTLV